MRRLAGAAWVVSMCTVTLAASRAPVARSGFVDLEIGPRSSPELEKLAAEQRFVDAFDRAITELRERLARVGPDHPDTLTALHRVGTVAHLAGDQATAEDVLGAALEARKRLLPPGEPAIVETLLRCGRAARFRGDRGRARSFYDQAESLLSARRGRYPALEGESLQLRADWVRGEDEPTSIPLYEQSLALRRTHFADPSFATADNETWLAWTLSRTGRRAEIKPYVRDAARQFDALGLSEHTLRATLHELTAEELILEGRGSEAEDHYRTAAGCCAAARRRQAGGYARRGFPLDCYDALALDAVRRGQSEEAWRLVETGRAPTHVDFSALALWERDDTAGFEAWTADRHVLDRVRKRLRALSGGPPVWNARTVDVFLETLAARARISRATQRYLERHRPEAPSLERVQSLLGSREALVGWLEVRLGGTPLNSFAPDRSEAYAYVVRSTGPVTWVPLWRNRSSADDIAMRGRWGYGFTLLNRAASWPTRVAGDAQLDESMREWGRSNVDPLLPHLNGVDRLILERLIEPVELAVLPSGQRLGDAFDVAYVPSALTFLLLAEARQGRRPSGDRSILAVAGPTQLAGNVRVEELIDAADSPSQHRGGRSAYRRDVTPLAALPKLRYAELETRAIASLFERPLVLEGNAASASIARLARADRLAGFRVMHVASHTLTDGAPERCALALSDHEGPAARGEPGLLEVEDIVLGWRLDADLVTLSGCETLRAAGAGRGEPFGFTPALFAAGARRVLSSMWPVDDRATTILMSRFYENYTGRYADRRFGVSHVPMGASRALREARTYVRTLTDAAGRHPYEHPVYWAGFFLLGLPD